MIKWDSFWDRSGIPSGIEVGFLLGLKWDRFWDRSGIPSGIDPCPLISEA